MAEGCRFGRARAIPSGVAATMTSAGVLAFAHGEAERIAASANAAAIGRRAAIDGRTRGFMRHVVADGSLSEAPYRAVAYAGRADSIAAVRTATYEGARDQALNHTLDSLNH